MKTYIQPTTKVVMIQHVNFIAQSLGLKGTAASTSGNDYSKALGREDNSWDIWGNNDDLED